MITLESLKVAEAIQDGSPRKMLAALLLSQIAEKTETRSADERKPDKATGTEATPTPPPPPENTPPPPPDVQKKKAVKSPEEKHFVQCSSLGKKLDGMITHANSIVSQAQIADNLWYWARSETKDLETKMDDVKPANAEWATKIRTSNVHVLKKDMMMMMMTMMMMMVLMSKLHRKSWYTYIYICVYLYTYIYTHPKQGFDVQIKVSMSRSVF